MNTDGNTDAINRRLDEDEARDRWEELLAAEERVPALEELIEKLEDENRILTTSGIIEVAVRNSSVMDYMQHWEGRVEELEAKLAKAREALRLIADRHMPSEPMTYGGSELHWAQRQYGRLRLMARAAHDATLAEIGGSHE